MHGIPSRHGGGEVEGEAHQYDHEDHRDITQWGWEEGQDGEWTHPSGQQGYWTPDGSVFVNSSTNQVYDPVTYEVTDVDGELPTRHDDEPIQPREFLRRNPTRPSPVPEPDPFSYNYGRGEWAPYDENNPANAYIEAGGWEHVGDGEWFYPETGDYGAYLADGRFINKTQGVQYDHRTGQQTPFDMHGGYQPLNEEFTFDAEGQGYQPLNEEFAFNDAGYQPFGTEFEFDASDLEDDPGYQWRLEQGQKGIERAGSAGGFLGSGRTLKRMGRWSQGLASQEYDRAYGRERSEFDLRRDQTRGAYGRAWDEFGQRQHQTLGAYGRATDEYDRRYSQSLDAYGRDVQQWGLEYGTESDSYNRAWTQFLNRQQNWQQDRENRLSATILGTQV